MSNATPRARTTSDEIPVLPEDVPVRMPELPPQFVITTAEQFKAIAEPTRSRILGIIQNQPATAKQIADRLHIAPGAAGHHLRVLEDAGLAQIVAKRLVRGIVAKYYARTARIFMYQMSSDVTGGVSSSLDIINSAQREFTESLADGFEKSEHGTLSFPRARLSPERATVYQERLNVIIDDLLREPHDPNGEVYGVLIAMFRSPNYMQSAPRPNAPNDTPDPPVTLTTSTREGDEA
jgi:DNA-binding transcriptional ArsR family regulator